MDARLARRDAGITYVAFRLRLLAAAFRPRTGAVGTTTQVRPHVRVAHFALARTKDLLRGMEPGRGFGFTRR